MQRNKPFDPHNWPLGPVDIHVGRKLRLLRQTRGEAAKKCADILGITCNQLCQIETGQRHLQPRELICISVYFCVEPMYFFIEFEESNIIAFSAYGPTEERIIH